MRSVAGRRLGATMATESAPMFVWATLGLLAFGGVAYAIMAFTVDYFLAGP